LFRHTILSYPYNISYLTVISGNKPLRFLEIIKEELLWLSNNGTFELPQKHMKERKQFFFLKKSAWKDTWEGVSKSFRTESITK